MTFHFPPLIICYPPFCLYIFVSCPCSADTLSAIFYRMRFPPLFYQPQSLELLPTLPPTPNATLSTIRPPDLPCHHFLRDAVSAIFYQPHFPPFSISRKASNFYQPFRHHQQTRLPQPTSPPTPTTTGCRNLLCLSHPPARLALPPSPTANRLPATDLATGSSHNPTPRNPQPNFLSAVTNKPVTRRNPSSNLQTSQSDFFAKITLIHTSSPNLGYSTPATITNKPSSPQPPFFTASLSRPSSRRSSLYHPRHDRPCHRLLCNKKGGLLRL